MSDRPDLLVALEPYEGKLIRATKDASRSDILEWLGWEKCEACEGTGNLAVEYTDDSNVQRLTANKHEICLSGLVPPAHQVEAAGDALDVTKRQHETLEDAGRAALIAAMKAVSDD